MFLYMDSFSIKLSTKVDIPLKTKPNGSAHDLIVTIVGNKLGDQSSNRGWGCLLFTVCISFHANLLEKSLNPSLSPPQAVG